MSTTSHPTTQKAIFFHTPSSTLSLNTSAPIPASTSPSLLIRVHSTAITNGELTWAPFVNWPENHIPCYDVSGTVVDILSASPPKHNFKLGDRVYGRINAAREGAAGEFASLLLSEAALVPQGLNMQDAAAVPMSAHTAWQALFEHGLLTGSFSPTSVPHVKEDGEAVLGQAQGKRVLVLGAAGGVGIMAVQMAKLAGAWVAGTAGPRNKMFLEELGVDEVIDYTQTSVKEHVRLHRDGAKAKFDLVFDCVGGGAMMDGWYGVKDHGTYISIVPGFKEPDEGKPIGIKSVWFVMEARGEELERIGKFFTKGLLKATVDSVWKLDEYQRAFEKTGSGHARGKVVMRVGSDER
jgi:NADPH:quinone reductase-like Zn-dependent oxidoreductase